MIVHILATRRVVDWVLPAVIISNIVIIVFIVIIVTVVIVVIVVTAAGTLDPAYIARADLYPVTVGQSRVTF
jgi:hypothetical protein